MKPEELKKLVAQPESEELEFKSSLSDIEHLAAHISAFANTKGGRLVIGVRDYGKIVGLKNVGRARLRIKRALRAVSPSLQVVTETIGIDGKSVLVVTIPKGTQSPYLFAGQAFNRRGTQIKPITSQVIYSSITERAKSVDDLLPEIKRLSETIETLNQEVIVAHSWKTKILDMVLGGIIGAAIPLLICLALGL